MSSTNAQEVVNFFYQQFASLGSEADPSKRWCDLDELPTRLKERDGIDSEVIGLIVRDNAVLVGAAIAYRSPFSHDQWTVPVVAVEKGNASSGIPSYHRQKLGKLLMERLFKEIQKHHGKSVLADTNKRHDRGGSPEFLEACGFTLIGEIPGYFDGQPEETGLQFIFHL